MEKGRNEPREKLEKQEEKEGSKLENGKAELTGNEEKWLQHLFLNLMFQV